MESRKTSNEKYLISWRFRQAERQDLRSNRVEDGVRWSDDKDFNSCIGEGSERAGVVGVDGRNDRRGRWRRIGDREEALEPEMKKRLGNGIGEGEAVNSAQWRGNGSRIRVLLHFEQVVARMASRFGGDVWTMGGVIDSEVRESRRWDEWNSWFLEAARPIWEEGWSSGRGEVRTWK